MATKKTRKTMIYIVVGDESGVMAAFRKVASAQEFVTQLRKITSADMIAISKIELK